MDISVLINSFNGPNINFSENLGLIGSFAKKESKKRVKRVDFEVFRGYLR